MRLAGGWTGTGLVALGLAAFGLAVLSLASPGPSALAEEPVGGLDDVAKLVHQGDIPRAFVRAEQLLKERPGDVDVHVAYQDVALAAGRAKDLAKTYKATATAADATADQIYLYGRILAVKPAQTEYRRALRLDADHLRTLLAMGNLMTAEGQGSEAQRAFEHAAEVAPETAAPWLGLAHLARLSGAVEDCEAHLREAMKVEPQLVLARVELAALLFESQRYDDAKKLLTETAELAPEDPLPLIALGQLERVMARDPKAMRELKAKEAEAARLAAEAAAKAPPPVAGGAAGPAGGDDPAKDDENNPSEEPPKTPNGRAMVAFENATELDLHSVPALLLLAHTAILNREPILAQTALDAVARISPDHPDVLLFRAHMEIVENRLENAAATAELLLKKQKDLPEGLYVRGVTKEKLGSAKKAEKDYEKALRESDDDPLYWRALGALHSLQARWKDAIKCYEKVVKLTDSEPNSLWELSKAQYSATKTKEATDTLETLVALDPEHLAGWLQLARICNYDLRKTARRATQAYQAYLDLGGDDPDVPFEFDEAKEKAAKEK